MTHWKIAVRGIRYASHERKSEGTCVHRLTRRPHRSRWVALTKMKPRHDVAIRSRHPKHFDWTTHFGFITKAGWRVCHANTESRTQDLLKWQCLAWEEFHHVIDSDRKKMNWPRKIVYDRQCTLLAVNSFVMSTVIVLDDGRRRFGCIVVGQFNYWWSGSCFFFIRPSRRLRRRRPMTAGWWSILQDRPQWHSLRRWALSP